MEKLKVLMIEHFGGENIYSFCLCGELSQLDVDLTVVTTASFISGCSKFRVFRYYPSYEKDHMIRKRFKYVLAIVKTLVIIIREKFDVIHFQTFRLQNVEWILFIIISRIFMNTVFTCHNVYPHEASVFKKFIYRHVYRSAKKIIVHNKYAYDSLGRILKRNYEKVSIIPHGNFIYYEELSRSQIEVENTKRNNGRIELILFGVMREYKGLDKLLKALSKIKNNDFRLKVCGRADEEFRREYEEMAKQLGLETKTEFNWAEVPNEEVASVILSADIVVLPYRKIYQSGALLLAYSFAKPVIVSCIEGFRDDVIQGVNGYIVDFDNERELQAVIDHIKENTEELKKIGQFNREIAEKKYSWKMIAIKTLELYGNTV
ncbi:MAG: glycosyltransferase family 4 protein [Bacillota bacterium]